MRHHKMLFVVILLVVTQFAWGAVNPKYAGTPYENIETQSPKILRENTTRSGQISVGDEVDFFEVVNSYTDSTSPFPIADVELAFSCPQADSKVSMFGWYISVWKHYADISKADEKLKGYDQVSQKKCSDKFTFSIDQNDDSINNVASYYIGIQSACSTFPKRELKFFYMDTSTSISQPQECDTSDYKLKIGLIPKTVVADINTLTAAELKNAIPLGSIKTGQIKSANEKDIYAVETYSTTDTAGTNEVPLLFSCTAAAARQTNNWKLTVYDDKNTVVIGYPRFINGSDCGSTLVDDKGGFKFTLPKDSPRYFVSVQSTCDSQSKKDCTVETSQYNIARDVTKIYTGNLTAKNITTANASFKLTRCGLNGNSTIAVKVENTNLVETFKTKIPIKLQIGSMACQVLTSQSFSPTEIMLGRVTGNAEIVDAYSIAKDSASITLGECISSNKKDVASKITLTGTKLDLENLNPSLTTTATTTATTSSNNSVVIPIKVDIGDFHCEGREAFYIDNDKPNLGDKTYSNHLPIDIEDSILPVNLDLSKTDKIESASDMQLYYVDSSINSDTKLIFSCDASKRFNNDWKVVIYNSDKSLLGAPYIINGSDCGTGKEGDNGAYNITIPKTTGSIRYYLAVKSACDVDDSSCFVDKSAYTLSRAIDLASKTPVKPLGSFDTEWLKTKKNLGATSQTGQINALTETNVYQVDTGTEDANLTFSCINSVRYQNDWKLLIYDSAKLLKSTTFINGSSCGMGQVGDTGAYALTLTKDSPTYYVVVKSACESNDTTCVIDKSQYEIKRVTPAQAAANEAAKPCFGAGCAVTKPVKPFFK